MADKTKMILRNDPAKKRKRLDKEKELNENRKSKCDGCGTEMEFDPVDPTPVTEDLMAFINTQEHWAERHTPSIAWGMLTAVFNVVFHIAPNEKKAMQVITDCLDQFVGSGDA